ncbi:GNAT family N-acetyltransferase [Flavobacterium franklandianum]|uniref:GNAT family N-acetyltransferase n=1 Tax=Flavobacterium franklandianum TaxID=2594430 RepID=A0A553C6A2_9FLAO|nr:GNAT family N-acetyltransferase [Flavobacterium franklandianum]TRX23552.1 GNAT family N-acetyltransferase [Flavobacterium franklandianum]
MNYNFKKADVTDIPEIWAILQNAIIRRKNDGSNQWQDGYPNPEVIKKDIEKGVGYVLTDGENTIGYCAILINDEPEYLKIEGNWLTNTDFVVFHRVAIAEKYLGKNLSQKIIEFIEDFARKNTIKSLKADTNHDNLAMIKIFEKSGFTFCGIVYFRGSPRRAYEKVLV